MGNEGVRNEEIGRKVKGRGRDVVKEVEVMEWEEGMKEMVKKGEMS